MGNFFSSSTIGLFGSSAERSTLKSTDPEINAMLTGDMAAMAWLASQGQPEHKRR